MVSITSNQPNMLALQINPLTILSENLMASISNSQPLQFPAVSKQSLEASYGVAKGISKLGKTHTNAETHFSSRAGHVQDNDGRLQ